MNTTKSKLSDAVFNKIVAVVTALSLIFLQVPISSLTAGARAEAANNAKESVSEQSAIDVPLEFEHAYIVYDGQTIAEPATKVTLPSGTAIEFKAEADSGYQLESVKATIGGTETTLSAGDSGQYKLTADEVATAEKIAVRAITAPAVEDVEVEASGATATATEVADEADGTDETVAAEDESSDEGAEGSTESSEGTDATTSSEGQAANTQTEFTYSDSDAEVTAKLSRADAIPANAEFQVTRVTGQTEGYNYDAYLAALNESSSEIEYTSANTLLYDVAFMVEDDEGGLVEYEPESGTVAISIKFKGDQLTSAIDASDASTIEVKHLPLKSSVRDSVDSTADATNISAADIAVENAQKVSADVDGEEVSFTLDSLSIAAVTNVAAAAAAAGGTVTAISSDNADVSVAIYASEADRSAKRNALNDDYEISISQTLYGSVSFEYIAGEGPTTGRLTYTYTMPSNIKMADRAAATLYDKEGNVAGTWETKNNVVYFYYDESWALAHPNGGGNFDFDFTLDENSNETGDDSTLNFPGITNTITVKVKEASLSGNKTNSGVDADGYVSYTVTFNAEGDFDTFIFSDHLESSLDYVEGSFALDGVSFPVAITANADGTHDAAAASRSLSRGTHTITYKTKVDQSAYDALTNWQVLNNTRNSARWTYGNNGDLKSGSSDSWLWIQKNLVNKWSTGIDGDTISWVVQVNGSAQFKSNLADYSLLDELGNGMHYGSTVMVYDSNWQVYDVITVADGAKSFTYDFPESAGANTYFIMYSTVIEDLSTAQALSNDVTITPPDGSNPTKTSETYNYNPGSDNPGSQVEHPDIVKEVDDQSNAATTGVVTWHSTISGEYPEASSGFGLEYSDTLDTWGNRADVAGSNDRAYRIWFSGEPSLYVDGKQLVEGVDYEFDTSGSASYGWTAYGTNLLGDSVPVAFRIRFITDSDTMSKVVADKSSIDVYYDTTCDTTRQTYYNTGTVHVTSGDWDVYNKSDDANYTIEGVNPVNKTGWIWWDDNLGQYVAQWEMQANRTSDWQCVTDLKSPIITFVDTLPEGMTLDESSIDLWVVRPEVNGLKYISCNPPYTAKQNGRVVTVTTDLRNVSLQDWQQPFYDEATGSCYAWAQLRFRTTLEPEYVVHDGTEQVLRNAVTAKAGDVPLGSAYAAATYKDQAIQKSGTKSDDEPVIHYTIKVNEKAQKLDTNPDKHYVKLTDTLDYHTSLVLSSLKVADANTGDDITGECSVTVDNDVTDDNGNPTSSFTVTIPDERALLVTYDVLLTGTEGAWLQITNKASLNGITSKQTDNQQWFRVNHSDASVYGSNTYISITKHDSENVLDNNGRLEGAVFDLYSVDLSKLPEGDYTAEGLAAASTKVQTVTTDSNGSAKLYNESTKALQYDTLYYFKEVQAPAGYKIDDANPHFVMTAGSSYDEQYALAASHGIHPSAVTVYNVTDTGKSEPEKIDVSGVKAWSDGNDQDGVRPSSVTVHLLANGEDTGQTATATAADGWTFTFTDLDKTDADENEIVYSVTEDEVAGYAMTVTGSADEGFTIMNTHKPETVEIPVKKVWDDANNQDGKRLSQVTAKLYADGVEVTSVGRLKLSEANNWSDKFTDLPKYANGKEIVYTVKEGTTVSKYGYEKSVSGNAADGFTITNAHTPETTKVSGTKSWQDNADADGNRPSSVTIHLWADGVEVAAQTISAADGWAYEFADLPVYKEGAVGQKVSYTVTESDFADYAASIVTDGLINTYDRDTTSVSVKKAWNDADNQDGVRPSSVSVQLLANGSEYASVELSSASGWAYTWSDLPKRLNGEEVTYTVSEPEVEGYELESVSGNAADGFTITNKHTPEKTSVGGVKTWADNDDQDGKRPNSITVRLWNGTDEIASTTVTPDAAGNWAYEFTDLDKYDDGHLITYSVSEDEVADYETTVNGFTITNKHTPETTSVSGTKTWDDQDDADGKRPDEITVRLLANGSEVANAAVSADDGWAYEFTDLPKFADGAEIEYTIVEDTVVSYTTTVDGYDITNTHEVLPSTDLTITKTSTHDDQALLAGAKFVLTPDNSEYETQTATTDANGVASFNKLRRGQTYTLQETTAPGGYLLDSTVYRIAVSNDDNLTVTCTEGGLEISGDKATGFMATIADEPDGDFGSIIIHKNVYGEDGLWGNASTHPEINTIRSSMRVHVENVDTGDFFDFTGIGNAARYRRNIDLFNSAGERIGQVQVAPSGSFESTINNLPSGTWKATETADGLTSFVGDNAATTGTGEDWVRTTTYTVGSDSSQLIGTSSVSPQTITIDNTYYGNGSLVLTKEFGWDSTNLPGKYAGNQLGEDITKTILGNIEFTLTGREIGEAYTIKGSDFASASTVQVPSRSGDTTITVSYYNQVWTITNLPYDTYDVIETTDGYRNAGQETDTILHTFYTTGSFTVAKDATTTNVDVDGTTGVRGSEGVSESGAGVEVNGKDATVNVLNVYYRPKVVEATKTWVIPEGISYTPGDIQVQLVRSVNGVDNNNGSGKWNFQPVTAADVPEHSDYATVKTLHWNSETGSYDKVVFSELPAVTADGQQITYEVRELSADGTLVEMVNGTYTDADGNVLTEGNTYTDAEGNTATASWGAGWNIAKAPYAEEDGTQRYYSSSKGLTIVNTLDLNVSVRKAWSDANDQDGKRPGEVQVQLLANGAATGDVVTLNDDNGWEYTWAGLDGTGNTTYSVDEVNVPQGYTKAITSDGAYSYVVTNSHTPETTEVSGVKTWNDNDDQDGARPDSITVRLMNGTTEVASQVVTPDADGNWSYRFTGLDKYANGREIVYTVAEDAVAGYETEISGANIVNTHVPETTSLSGTKTWNDSDDQDGERPNSITVRLLANGEEVNHLVVTPDADGNWTYRFDGLPVYENGERIAYTVTEDAVDGYTTDVDGMNITNTHVPETTNVSGTKTWVDNDDQDGARPDSITVRLLANGDEVASAVVTAADNWAYAFNGLPVYENGEKIVYTIEEDAVDDYATTYDGYFITNTHAPDKTAVSGAKIWSDNNDQDGKRPSSITVHLLANGAEVASQVVTPDADGNWTYEFADLDKNANGRAITYTVTEDAVDGYDTSIDGFYITNSHTPEITEVVGTKTWVDNDDQDGVRPEAVTIRVWNGTTEVASKTVTAADNWAYRFTSLPKFENGAEIDYTVTEDAIGDYGTSVDGFYVTNTHSPEKTSVSGEKTWNDNNDQDGKRPSSITVRLWNGDDEVASQVVTPDADGNWTYEFTDLDKFANGHEITYTVTEDGIDGYSTEVSGTSIVNMHTPEKTQLKVIKEWDDQGDYDGLRPSSVQVQLLANGVATGEAATLNADHGWAYTWTGLDKYADGNEIIYTVSELDSEATAGNYTTGDPVWSDNEGAFVITNKHEVVKVAVDGTKTWSDANNQDGKRPSSITVDLLANGSVVASKVVTPDASGNWNFEFTELDKYSNGEEITYTISEQQVEGYTATISGDAASGFTIDNAYTPEETQVTVSKSWDDADNQDGIRPGEINVRLMNGTTVVDSAALNADNSWTYTWTGLDRYSNGTEIAYTVEEDAVADYSAEVTGSITSGFIIKNTHVPGQVDVKVDKAWSDANNQDGTRPGSVEVKLTAMAGGAPVALEGVETTAVLNDANNWHYEWMNLPQKHEGKVITYSIDEVSSIDGYTSTVTSGQVAATDTSNAAITFTVTNEHAPETTEVSATKAWSDANDQDGIRPASVSAQLKADGAAVGDPVALNAGNGWQASWSDLPKYRDGGTEVVYTVEEVNIPSGYVATVGSADNDYTITNSHTPDVTSAEVTKVWDDADNQDGIRPGSVTVQLMGPNGAYGDPIVLNDENGWSYKWENLPLNHEGERAAYSVVELDVPDSYTAEVTGSARTGFKVANSYTPGTTNVSVNKAWNDNENQDGIRPTTIAVQLYADGVASGEPVVLSAENGWAYTWSGLAQKSKGEDIAYTVGELDVPEGYVATITGDATSGFTIDNAHTPETTEVSATKEWNDNANQDGIRAEGVQVQLYADGVAAGDAVTLNADNNWTATWSDLPKKDDGNDIAYTVREVEVPQGYSVEVEGDAASGFVVTNTHVPEVTTAKVTKVWDDADNQDGKRPGEITVQLLANDGAYGDPVTLTSGNGWQYQWSELPKFANGEEVAYAVVESGAPDDYTATVEGDRESGFVITNSYTPGVTNVTVSKAWNDASDQDGVRPDSVKVRLLADGSQIDVEGVEAEVELNAGTNWSYTWENLDQMRSGREIAYTVEEVEVPEGYSVATSGSASEGYVVTNSYTPETTSVSVTKTWDDADDQDGKRPAGVTITLNADGEPVATQTVTADDNWEYAFTGLPKYRDGGVEIVYTISEATVADYEATIDGFDVTNFHQPTETTVEFFAMKTLNGRTLGADEFSFELLEGDTVLQRITNAGDGHARFDAITYTLADLGTHTYTIREVAGSAAGVTYDTTEHTFTAIVTDNGDGTLGVAYDGYDPEEGVAFENSYAPSGSVVIEVNKLVDGQKPAAGAYSFQLADAQGNVYAVATNDADGIVTFPALNFKAAGTYAYLITEIVPDGAQTLNGVPVVNGIAYDTNPVSVTIEAIDNFDGTMRFTTTYNGEAGDNVEGATINNTSVPDTTFPLSATKAIEGRDFQAGDSFTFNVSADSDDAPMPENASVTVSPTGGSTTPVDFGDITFTSDDLGKTYTYTITEANAGETSNGLTNDPFSHWVKLTVGDAGDGTLSVTAEYQNDADGITFTNSYAAAGEAVLTATKVLEGRDLADNEFFFKLSGDNLPADLTAHAAADGTIAFPTISFTQADAGKDFHYTMTEVQGTLGGVTYDDASYDVTVHVEDNGDGSLAIAYDYGTAAGATFTNTYRAEGTSVELSAHKALVGGTLEGGEFSFTLTGTSANAAGTTQTVSNAADGTVTFDAIDFNAPGTYEYTVAEQIPAGATDNGDGTFTGSDGVVYDATSHTVTITVTDNGVGKLVATVEYDGGAAEGISFGNTALARTGFEFTKYYFGGVGSFDFTLTAADSDGNVRTGDAVDYSDAATIVDDGSQAFTATVQNGAFTSGSAPIVFPEVSYAADGDYYYLIEEAESSSATVVTDSAKYLAHVVVRGGEVASTTFDLIYNGQNLGATTDLSFYNNSKVKLGFNSLSTKGYTDQAERTSVYPKAKKYLNDSTDQLIGGEFSFELIDDATGAVLAVATNDENGDIAFFDENNDPGLAYDEAGTFHYTIREVAGNEAGITYDTSAIGVTVVIEQTAEGLAATMTYNGPGGAEPAFYNVKDSMNVTVQKVSREGGEGLAGAVYALWMVSDGGDVLVAEATSDANGYITFNDVNLIAGQKYYFKEVEAPAGHTVDPYRTAYFSLNASGTKLVLVEKTASDGWHAATEVKK